MHAEHVLVRPSQAGHLRAHQIKRPLRQHGVEVGVRVAHGVGVERRPRHGGAVGRQTARLLQTAVHALHQRVDRTGVGHQRELPCQTREAGRCTERTGQLRSGLSRRRLLRLQARFGRWRRAETGEQLVRLFAQVQRLVASLLGLGVTARRRAARRFLRVLQMRHDRHEALGLCFGRRLDLARPGLGAGRPVCLLLWRPLHAWPTRLLCRCRGGSRSGRRSRNWSRSCLLRLFSDSQLRLSSRRCRLTGVKPCGGLHFGQGHEERVSEEGMCC